MSATVVEVGMGSTGHGNKKFVVGEVLLQEDAIDIEEVDGVAYLAHLIIMYHTHMRMVGGCPDVVGVVVDAVDFQVYFHRCKYNKVQCILQLKADIFLSTIIPSPTTYFNDNANVP